MAPKKKTQPNSDELPLRAVADKQRKGKAIAGSSIAGTSRGTRAAAQETEQTPMPEPNVVPELPQGYVNAADMMTYFDQMMERRDRVWEEKLKRMEALHAHGRRRAARVGSEELRLSPSPDLNQEDAECEEHQYSPISAENRRQMRRMGQDREMKAYHPFTDTIMTPFIPKDVHLPANVRIFYGQTDPEEHIHSFMSAMLIYPVQEHVHCRLFPGTLGGRAMRWFMSLPEKSVFDFQTLKRLFVNQFSTSRYQHNTWSTLMAVKQGERETLREYLKRFLHAYNNVQGVTPEIGKYAFAENLKSGSEFRRDLLANEPTDMNDVLERAKKYLAFEDVERFDRKEKDKNGSSKSDKLKEHVSTGR